MKVYTLNIFILSLQSVYGIGDFDYYDAFDSAGENYRGKYIGDLATFHHQVILNQLIFFKLVFNIDKTTYMYILKCLVNSII